MYTPVEIINTSASALITD